MSNTNMRCPICKKTPIQPINLKCEHHPCFGCIQPHVAIDPQSKMQTKYRVSCTACNRKTVFYDLRHLILTHSSHEDEELFVTDRFLSARGESKHQPVLIGPGRQESDGVGMTRRGSIQSIANGQKMLPEVRCPEHNEPYKYFCYDCGQNGNPQCLLCGQCSRPHHASSHRLIGMRQAQGSIQAANLRSKEEMAGKKQEIDCISAVLNQNKTTVQEHYRLIEESLHCEFKRMFTSLNERYTKLRNILRDQQERSLRQIEEKKQKLVNHRNILQTLEDIELKDLQTSLKFYQTYQKYAASAMPTHLVPIELPILPQISSNLHHLDAILEDSIQFDWQKTHDTSSKKSRKNSNVEEQLSHRSTREKENRTRLAPTELKFNLKRTVT